MNKKTDQNPEKILLEAYQRFHQDMEKLRQKREEQLWKEVTVPCRLFSVLTGLTKHELDCIRKNLDLKGISAMKKNELAEKLEHLLPGKVSGVFNFFDDERYRLAKRICENGGFVYEKGISSERAERLRERGVIFSGSKNGRRLLFMPLELVDIFKSMDDPVYLELVQRNTEWIKLTYGLLYYYGFLNLGQLGDMIGTLTGEKPEPVRHIKLLRDAVAYYGQIRPAGGGYCIGRADDVQKIRQEHKARPDVEYRPFTKKQLLKAGVPGYIDWTPALKMFMNFLREHYDFDKEETDEIAAKCLYIINSDDKPEKLLKYLQSFLEFPSFEFVQELTRVMMPLFNNTRRWILKGHTPEELFREEKKHLKPLPETPLIVDRPVSRVVDLRTKKQVGRNDPCPCGSGKKFKKCCGK